MEVNTETDLLTNLERKLNELKNKDEESGYKLENFTNSTELEDQNVPVETKSIHDYDKEISDKVSKLALCIPSLDDEKDGDLDGEDDAPLVDIEELKRKYGIKDEDIDGY